MLNRDSLAQLKGLKQQMEAEKERAQAVIKGTQARYGFAVLDDGREIFIPPDEMLKAFPEDRVWVCIRPARDNKTIADIETLVDSPLADFTGRCVKKGKAMFVQPDLPHLRRWLFLPPHARNGAQEGDYLRCAILRHPIKDGRPQAKVLAVIGNDDTPGIENLYCAAKYGLGGHRAAGKDGELKAIQSAAPPLAEEHRHDLNHLEFVSIDAAKTQDIDDALYAEVAADGWMLYVAIADPTAYIGADSALAADIAARGTSVYFHGDVLPMMPEELSQDICALAEGVERPALVCKLAVSDSGEVGEFEFMTATIRSRAKLSYYAVDKYLTGQDDELMSHASPLETLYQVYRALRTHREGHELVMEERQEYRWILNDNKQIEHIEPYEKLLSQRLVEECMVAANRCGARFLAQHAVAGPFVSHPGFRDDREDETRKFLSLHAPSLADSDWRSREGYRDVMHALSKTENGQPLRGMVNRLLTRARLSVTPEVHMGMALPAYTNCTSPLRKYLDFLAHQQIKRTLFGSEAQAIDQAALDQLSERLANVRAATLEAERWLSSRYLARLAQDDKGRVFRARVSHINSSGFSVRLEESGLEGFVDLRKDPEKFSFDKWTASLTSTTRRFQLEQSVELLHGGLNPESLHQTLFTLVEGCGLKPPKPTTPEEKVEASEVSQPAQHDQERAAER